MAVIVTEGQRAVLCAIWFGAGAPVRNPALMTGMHRVKWSCGEAEALNMAEAMASAGLVAGNPADGYVLTDAGAAAIA